MDNFDQDDNMSMSTVSGNQGYRLGRRTADEETAITNARLNKAADFDDKQTALGLIADCNMMMLRDGLNFDQLSKKLRTIGLTQDSIAHYINGLDLVKKDTKREHKELAATHPVARKVKLRNC